MGGNAEETDPNDLPTPYVRVSTTDQNLDRRHQGPPPVLGRPPESLTYKEVRFLDAALGMTHMCHTKTTILDLSVTNVVPENEPETETSCPPPAPRGGSYDHQTPSAWRTYRRHSTDRRGDGYECLGHPPEPTN